MATSTTRGIAAGFMLAGAAIVIVGVALASQAVWAIDLQVSDLDPSRERAGAAFEQAARGAAFAAVGLLAFLVALLAFVIARARARRRGEPLGGAPSAVAWTASGALALVLLFALAWPQGPLMTATSLASGGGGPGGATQVEIHNGTLTGTSLSPTPPEDVYTFHPVSREGSIRVRLGSGGMGVNASAVAVLEAMEPGGAWRTVAQVDGPNATLDVPAAAYPGDLRIRVHLGAATLGKVEYVVAVSFKPS